jgi:hypothetical protein
MMVMTDTISLPMETPRRLHLDWVVPVLFRPRQAFAKISTQSGGVWLTPLLILTVTAILAVIVAGPIKKEAALSGQMELPENFQYFSPEDQMLFQQAMSATQGNVFIYVFPALTGVVGVWIGWLVVGGLVYLALTLLGGRGAASSVMNLIAWASLPFAVRDLVRIAAMLSTQRLISHPGLAGFAPAGDGTFSLFLGALFALIDLYVIWHLVLIVVGVRVASGLPLGKAVGGILFVILLVLSIQALIIFFGSRLAAMTIIRQF